ncbi:MFS superfamily sulfate permease-like transporter [Thiogranum longum]|uniref:MFS superfamily sulfate permease-like transporter n=1 Tax=Thiogranum longum TaxID=1537524 RepID=A0A4R1HET9_9GAMM|nr:SulP family inorganic anion transporter [Thiogranum longum]TCK18710.1 MFS superfamily sulfate permease-like transporter [Thiogranum longum]
MTPFSYAEISRNVFPGFVMALINLPMSIGFAFLAGIPPVMMIIASIVCAVIGHFLNASRYAVGGPNSATSILIAVAITPFAPQMSGLYIGYVASLALMVGIWQLLFCFIFAKYHITDYFNQELIDGLVLGIGIIFVLATLYMVLGLPQLSYQQWLVFDVISLGIGSFAGEGSYFALILGCITIVTGLLIRRSKYKRYNIIGALAVGIVALLVLESYYSFHIERVGWINLGLATSLPDFRQASLPVAANFIAPAFVIAIISTLQAITVAKAIRADDEVMNPLRDIFSQGIQHIALSLLHGAPVANSINKSIAKKELGSGSRALLYSAAFTIILVVFLDFVIAYIPLSILGGLLFLSGLSMVNVGIMKRYLRSSRKAAAIFFSTAFLVVVVDIYTAVTFAILATFIINIIEVSKVHLTSRIENGKTLVITMEGTILCHSCSQISRYFNEVIHPDIQEVVLDARNAHLHTNEIMDFKWLATHASRGVKVRFLFKETARNKLDNLVRLNPDLAGFMNGDADTQNTETTAYPADRRARRTDPTGNIIPMGDRRDKRRLHLKYDGDRRQKGPEYLKTAGDRRRASYEDDECLQQSGQPETACS